MFDTLGTLIGVATKAEMLDKDGKLPRVKQALVAEAVATTAGAVFGTSTTTTFVEFLMISSILDIDFKDLTEAVPAYLCILCMPLMYSISEGIAIGVISYVVINVTCGKAKKITPLMYVLTVLFVCKYIFL